MPDDSTSITPGAAPTTAPPAPPKPTAADLRKSAEQMREMAKGTQTRAAEARAQEKRFEGELEAADRRGHEASDAGRRAEVEKDAALGRAEGWKRDADSQDRAGDVWRGRMNTAIEEAERVEATDPAKAADLREQAERYGRFVAEHERREEAAREAETKARAEAREWETRAQSHYDRRPDAETRAALEAEAERWEQQADELEAIARSQLDQAGALDASAANLEIETAAAPTPAGALLEEQEDAALEVLGAVAPEDGVDASAAVALADATASDSIATDSPLSENGDDFAQEPGEFAAESPLADAMSADEVAMAAVPEDDAMLGSELEETGGTELADPAAAPVDEMGDVEV